MNKQQQIKAIQRVLGPCKEIHGQEMLFFCPYHSHFKPKLSINFDKSAWHCWICSRGGRNLLRLLRINGETEDYKEYKKSLLGDKLEEKSKNYEAPELPPEFRTLTKEYKSPYYFHAMEYLNSRNITKKDIFRYKIGYCEDGEYKNRIVFPSFDSDGDLNFVISRAFYSTMKPYHHGEYDKNIIFNEYLVNWNLPVVIVEGVFDAITAGNNSISMLGSNLGEESKLFIKLLDAKEIYLAFDTDAKNKQNETVELFLEYGKMPFVVDLNGAKDPSSMGAEAFGTALSLAKKISSQLDLLKLKVGR